MTAELTVPEGLNGFATEAQRHREHGEGKERAIPARTEIFYVALFHYLLMIYQSDYRV